MKWILLTLLVLGLIFALFAHEDTTSVAMYGEGATIIAIHGSPGDKNDFRNLGPQLDGKVYALDMPGFGGNSGSGGIADASSYVITFIESQNLTNVTLLGYSWGGGVAFHVAAERPDLVSKLILLDSWGLQEAEATGTRFGEQLRYVISYPFVVLYPGSLWNTFARRHGFMMSYIGSDLRETPTILQRITVPTYYIEGTNDTVVPMWAAEKMVELIPNATLLMYPGHHGSIFGNATEIAEVINDLP